MALTQKQQAMLADGILTADAAGRLKMADNFVNTAKVLDGSITNVNIGSANFGSANTYYNLGSIVIPSAGVWRINAHLRWGSPSVNMFMRAQLSTTTGNGGVFVNPRMQFENLQASSGNINISLSSEWIIQMGTGITFPYTIYLGAFQGNNSGSIFLANDVNGYNELAATKLASTSSTASSPVQVGA
jgi:hypothetical protein